jgi:hypothetical protein
MRALLAVLLLSACSPPIANPYVVLKDPGGNLIDRLGQIHVMREEGVEVKIHGVCASACTLYLDMPGVCVSPGALLGFHGAQSDVGGLAETANLVLANSYRGELRERFKQIYARQQDMAWLTGRQVHELSGVALCE